MTPSLPANLRTFSSGTATKDRRSNSSLTLRDISPGPKSIPHITLASPTESSERALLPSTSTSALANHELTSSALNAHNHSPPDRAGTKIKDEKREKLERAAKELGINLPPKCFESEKRELDEWLEEQCLIYFRNGSEHRGS